MIEYVEKAKLCDEELVKLLDKKIENIEIDKQNEIDKAVAEINAKYDERLDLYKSDRKHYVDLVAIEKPDEETSEEECAVAEDTAGDNAESVINEETGYVNEQSNF